MGARRKLCAVACLALTAGAVVAGCGGGDDNGAGVDLNWFIFNEPSGGPTAAAERCSRESNGRYNINFEYLPSDADGQREQLVRRLGAEDDTIDIIGMDVIWTGEFANAGWIQRVPEGTRATVTENVFESVLDTARFEDELYAAPIWSNTQLLWYRTDRVDEPPETWDEMIDKAEEIGPAEGTIQVQANRYEGLMVWFNALVKSAGTEIVSGSDEVALAEEPTKRALSIMGRLANSPVADPGISTSNEDSARLGFEGGGSAFMINYPFVHPSAEENAPDVFKNMGAAKYPAVDPSIESAPPLGGINLGISSFSKNSEVAWEAVECLVQVENQIEIADAGGLPPVRSDLYDRPEVQKIYPGFADVIRESIQDAAPRPSESPAYQDLTLGIQRALHPPSQIDPQDPNETYERVREAVEQAIAREGLL